MRTRAITCALQRLSSHLQNACNPNVKPSLINCLAPSPGDERSDSLQLPFCGPGPMVTVIFAAWWVSDNVEGSVQGSGEWKRESQWVGQSFGLLLETDFFGRRRCAAQWWEKGKVDVDIFRSIASTWMVCSLYQTLQMTPSLSLCIMHPVAPYFFSNEADFF